MYATGHVGLGFAGAAVLVTALSAIGLPELAIGASALFVALSTLPDVDEWVPWTTHRAGTHSVWFALAVGAAAAAVATRVGPVGGVDGTTIGILAFAIGFVAVALHVVADAFTPMGVYPLWPFSAERRSLHVVASAHPWANRLAFGVGLSGWLVAVGCVWLI